MIRKMSIKPQFCRNERTDYFKYSEDRKALNEETRIKALLEDRIKVLQN